MPNAAERAELARRFFPAAFQDSTMILDGTDCPVQLFRRRYDHNSREYYSFKFKGSGLRTQVILLANRMCGWTSDSLGCATHDKTQQTRSNFLAVANLAPTESALSDLGYQGLPYASLPHKKPPHGKSAIKLSSNFDHQLTSTFLRHSDPGSSSI